MISIYGQENLKTITEDFQEGKATYQYYEDQTTGNFVKHGTFKYVKQQGSYAETATGTFNKGMRMVYGLIKSVALIIPILWAHILHVQ